MDKRIVILLAIIGILLLGIGYMLSQQNSVSDVNATIANNTTQNTTVINATLEKDTQQTESGEYGYCAICGNALTYSEANNEFTQGKVCDSCALNPDYQSGEGADYANSKLAEAYPDEYEGMFDDSSENHDNENNGDIETAPND